MAELTFDTIATLSEDKLVELINHHNHCYWEQGRAEISDELYDALLRRLYELNPEHSLLQTVHAPQVAGTGKITHREPMLSLDKAYSLEEVLDWAVKYIRSEDEELLIQPKYDGISANYSDGILATRGDGFKGENISDKLPLIELETKDYRGPVDRPVRGEIVIRNDDFDTIYSRIRRKGGGRYKNSRNAVAGIMGLKDISDMQRQGAKLTLVDYDMISFALPYRELRERWDAIVAQIEQLPYPLDGIVIKLADRDYAASLGNTAHHPRGQIAFKFSGVRRETLLRNIEWSFGKNCLTPVAEIEPVEIGGITIRHATLHNVQNIIDKDLHIGDWVVVERAGDVIPYIISSRPGKERRNAIITHCPCCQHELIRNGPELCCSNPDCFETELKKLALAVKNIGIERLGEPNIRRMMQQLKVKNLKDIFELTREQIMSLDGFQAKSADNLLEEIQKARQVTDVQLLAALNIPNIGKNIAKLLLSRYTLEELRRLPVDELARVDGIGPERAEALYRELREQADFLDELSQCVTVSNTKGEVEKPTICFTGKMPEKRSFYEEIARNNGYEPVGSVNKNLKLLVAMNPKQGGSKLQKAAKLGIRIVALEDWLQNPSAVTTQISATSTVDKKEQVDISAQPLSASEQVTEQLEFDF